MLDANRFQQKFWAGTDAADWISISAPTAAGKTYIVLRWMLEEFISGDACVAVYLAPTRALVSEIEGELHQLAASYNLSNTDISSLPLRELYETARAQHRRAIFVFTQERLHLFANSIASGPVVDLLIVDEAHKVGDKLRGVVLQDAVERLTRVNGSIKVAFLSPATENPEALLDDAPDSATTRSVDSDTPTVNQNLITATQDVADAQTWHLSLRYGPKFVPLGDLRVPIRPVSVTKRIASVAAALGVQQTGTLVYANGPAEAAKIAWLIADITTYPGDPPPVDDDLEALSRLIRETVHPKYSLATLVKQGVAFHYGNMPALLRAELERIFRKGKLRFLVCTSTLVEGVNLACRTIVLRGPRKGKATAMTPQDFWNLAGRAGRWGHDFQGNIVCVDADVPGVWPNGVPERTRYPIRRETDAVLSEADTLVSFLNRRWDADTKDLRDNAQLEQVGAYLLALKIREGSLQNAQWASRYSLSRLKPIDDALGNLCNHIEIPDNIASRHPGVSAVGMQKLLNYFRERKKPVSDLIPAAPESTYAQKQLTGIFIRINRYVFPAFGPVTWAPIQALVTVEWMRGHSLARIIRSRIDYLTKKDKPYKLQALILDTMQLVEEVARFRAPKYLSCYLDVLKLHLHQIGRPDLFPEQLNFDMYLEFGVSTTTLLSLIRLGLSRVSAIALHEYIGRDDLTVGECISWVETHDIDQLDLPEAIRKEIVKHLVTPENGGGGT